MPGRTYPAPAGTGCARRSAVGCPAPWQIGCAGAGPGPQPAAGGGVPGTRGAAGGQHPPWSECSAQDCTTRANAFALAFLTSVCTGLIKKSLSCSGICVLLRGLCLFGGEREVRWVSSGGKEVWEGGRTKVSWRVPTCLVRKSSVRKSSASEAASASTVSQPRATSLTCIFLSPASATPQSYYPWYYRPCKSLPTAS